MDILAAYHLMTKRLRAYRSRHKTVQVAERLFQFLAGALVGGLFLPLFYAAGQHDTVFRWLISVLTVAAALYFGQKYVVRPLLQLLVNRNAPGLDRIALQIGLAFPAIKDKLSNAFQIMQEIPNMRGASPELATAAFAAAQDATQDLRFTASIDTRAAKRNFAWFTGTLLLFVIFYSIFPAKYSTAFALLLHPSAPPLADAVRIEVTPGDAEIVQGSRFQVQVQVHGLVPASARIRMNYKDGGFEETDNLHRDAPGEYTYTLESVTENFSYSILIDKLRSRVYRVAVIELPDVRELQVTLTPPAYSGLAPQKLDPNVGNFSALPGTRVQVAITPNKPIQRARLAFASGDTLELQEASGHYEAVFQVKREDSYSFLLQDAKDLQNRNPIVHRIGIVPDQSPVVEIIFPGRDMDIDEGMEVPIAIQGEDDFGFSRLEIELEVIPGGAETEPKFQKIKIPYTAANARLKANFLWDLIELELLPEDAVEYRAVLYDNDTVSGPKKAVSKKYRLRFPSVQEIFKESARQQQEALDAFDEMLDKTREMKENVQAILDEMRRDDSLDWQEKQMLKENLAKQEKAYRQLDEAQKNLEEMMQRLQKNDLMSVETLQKYQELQALLEEIATPEMKRMLQKLQEAIEQVDPKQVQKALEELQASEDHFRKSIEKTINLLKQLQAEQKLEEAKKLTEEMLDRQSEVNKNVQRAPDSSALSKLSEQEQMQQESLRELQQMLDNLQKRMNELPQMQMPKDKIEQARRQSKNPQLQQNMQQMQQQLEKGQKNQAQNAGRKISDALQQMQTALSKAQQQMQQQQKSAVMKALQRGSRDLLSLSKRQESLGQNAQNRSQATTNYRQLAEQQQNLLSGMQRVSDQLFNMSQNSFFVPPEVARELGKSMRNMQSAISDLEGQRGRSATQKQGKAMQALNNAVSRMRAAMKQLDQAGGQGAGLEQMLKNLLGMSEEQQGINSETERLGNTGNLTMEQQASLSRLAARQEALRKSMQQLAREYGNRKEVLGSLDKIAEEMSEVVQDLQRREIKRQTLNRQKRILSRLLDAQKSAQQRDYSRQRRAETGKKYLAVDPGALPANLGEVKTRLQQDLLRALRENYSKDYKLLIQKYFDALSREIQKNAEQ